MEIDTDAGGVRQRAMRMQNKTNSEEIQMAGEKEQTTFVEGLLRSSTLYQGCFTKDRGGQREGKEKKGRVSWGKLLHKTTEKTEMEFS